MSNVSEVMEQTLAKLREMIDTNAVVGQPITTPDGTTLIPVTKVTFGFASGGTDGNNLRFGAGSGAGVSMAQALGHTVTALRPSLVPLVAAGPVPGQLEGLSLRNVGLTVRKDGRELYTDFGELVFTADGLSGPLVLSASAHLGRGQGFPYALEIDLKPALDRETLDRRLLRDFSEQQNRDFQNVLSGLLPARLIPVMPKDLLERADIDAVLIHQRRRRVAQLVHGKMLLVYAGHFQIFGDQGLDRLHVDAAAQPADEQRVAVPGLWGDAVRQVAGDGLAAGVVQVDNPLLVALAEQPQAILGDVAEIDAAKLRHPHAARETDLLVFTPQLTEAFTYDPGTGSAEVTLPVQIEYSLQAELLGSDAIYELTTLKIIPSSSLLLEPGKTYAAICQYNLDPRYIGNAELGLELCIRMKPHPHRPSLRPAARRDSKSADRRAPPPPSHRRCPPVHSGQRRSASAPGRRAEPSRTPGYRHPARWRRTAPAQRSGSCRWSRAPSPNSPAAGPCFPRPARSPPRSRGRRCRAGTPSAAHKG